VHLESAETDLNLPSADLDRRGKPSGATDDKDNERPSREGLPAAFKMRREKHYVEQLMGDAPLRTVREIPVADIEAPDDKAGDVEDLQESIKDVGILQPLLVAPQGTRYRIIAGGNRYRAATQLGLRTVPCLVYEAGAHGVETLRQAAARRAAPPVSPEPSVEPLMPSTSEESRQSPPAAGLREVTARLAFVSAVMPALDVAGYDALRWNTLTDLMKVEMERARSTAAAIEWLSSESTTAVREPLDAASVLDAVLDAIGPEARLLGVKLDLSSTLSGYRLPVDRAMLVRALTGLFQAMLALSPAGSTLRVNCSGTAVRPALVVTISQEDCEVGPRAADHFFDPDFPEHPNGASGALVLAGVALAARLHGGRVNVRADDERGCTATFVVPRPLEDATLAPSDV
jgi:ParB-like nuclease family protein